MFRPRGPSLALVAVLLAAVGARADGWPVPRGASREPAPYRYDPAAWKDAPRDFLDDAPACVLYSGTTHLVSDDGTVETITHEVTRFNGRKAVEKLGEYRGIVYTPAHQALTLNEARVHKADGRTLAVTPGHLHLRDVAGEALVYDHDKQLVISFPALEVGDVVEVKWTVRGRNPEHQGRFFTRYNFGDDGYPVVLDELRVRLPKATPFRYAASGGRLEPAVAEDGAARTYHWQARHRRQLPQDADLPSKEDLRLQVSASTFASWDEVGAWKGRLRRDCWQCADEVRKVVQDVTRGLASPRDKARALTYWLRRNVRYVSAGDKHDFTPHPPGQVLANRYGDCKDTSQLLAVMLREAGVPVALATLGTRDDGQVLEQVPSPWGTHAILLVTLDGKPHWIDTTLSLGAWDDLPREDRDRLCYVVDDKGLRLVRTPPATADDHRTEQTTHIHIGCDGSSRCERKSVYHGASALAQRDAWLEVPAGERRRLATAELQDANAKTRLVKLTLDEARLRDLDAPVRAEVVFEIPGHFGDPDREGSVTDSKVWGRLLSVALDYDRTVPLDLGAPFESRHRFVFHLPPAFRLDAAPRGRAVRSPWGSFTLTVKSDPADPRALEVESLTRLDKTRVEPADFDAFRKFDDDVSKHYRVWLTLKATEDEADIPALEALCKKAPQDAAAAAALGRLYLRAGKAAQARRFLKAARKRHPRDAALWELTLQAAEGLAEEEEAYRALVRHFPADAKYALALAGTLVDRGKQDEARTLLEPVARGDEGAVTRALAHYHLARSLMASGDAAGALVRLKTAVDLDPATAEGAAFHALEGRAFEKLGRAKEAALSYANALGLEPANAEALLAVVRIERAAGRPDAALAHLRRYSAAVRDDRDGLLRAAELYLDLDRPDDAFELAERAREQPFHEKTHRVLGLVRSRRGDHGQAVFHLEKASPDAVVVDALVRGYLALGRLSEAERLAPERVVELARRRDVLLKAVGKKGDDGTAALERFVCAEAAWKQGRPVTEVETLLGKAFTAESPIGPAFALRGLLALERGKLSQAHGDAGRAVALSPREPLGYLVRGRVGLEREAPGALADLAKAVELSGHKDAFALHGLASALLRQGKRAEALAAQHEAVRLRPDDAELRVQLEELEKAEGIR